MAAPASRLLLNNGKASLRLSCGSSMIRPVLSSTRDHRLLAPTQSLGHIRFPEPPRVDPEALRGTQESISLLRAGRSWPVFEMETARSYCRGRHSAEISDDDGAEVSDEEFDDDGEYDDDLEGFNSDDVYDVDEEMDEEMDDDDEEGEKPRKRK